MFLTAVIGLTKCYFDPECILIELSNNLDIDQEYQAHDYFVKRMCKCF